MRSRRTRPSCRSWWPRRSARRSRRRRARSCWRCRATCSTARPTFRRPRRSSSRRLSAAPDPAALAEAARLLAASERPVLWAGGGVLRSGAAAAFTALAERLDAPAVTTYMGKGAIPADHPLCAGSASYEPAVLDLLRTADVVLAVGTELGETATSRWSLAFEGRLIQVDVRAEHLGRELPGRARDRRRRRGRARRARCAGRPRDTRTAPRAPRGARAARRRASPDRARPSSGCCARCARRCRATASPSGT